MLRWKNWLALPYGLKLKKLHSWNAWFVLILAVTGVLLYLPSLRGATAFLRVGLKQFHIYLGLISVSVIVLYLPVMRKHLKQIRRKKSRQFNLGAVLILLTGWFLSGFILWLFRFFPPSWTRGALLIHDGFTWVGIPWILYHSVTRSKWLKQKELDHQDHLVKGNVVTADPKEFIAGLKKSVLSRRQFLGWTAGILFILSIGPSFYRWLKKALDNGGTQLEEVLKTDGNRMIPPPSPLPDSDPPLGGGLEGNFRVYTVTDIPSFTSENWKFAVGGLVSNPVIYNWNEFLNIPRRVQVSDFHCVTGWSVYHVTWEGIPLKALLDRFHIDPKARYVKFYSGDGVYTDTLTLDQAYLDDVMIAVMMDGKPIPQKLGGPVRLVVPKMYAYKSVKWLQAVELIEKEHIGYWEARGYDTNAWVGKIRTGGL